jgi:hypothetical protein
LIGSNPLDRSRPAAPFRSLVASVGRCSLLLALVACSRSAPPESEAWRGERTVSGGVTTVRTLSGSVWPGPARLVEEASIGRPEGDEAYLLANVTDLYLDGGRIYVLDRGVPVLRVYDRQGNHLFDAGRSGDGPGEFRNPSSVAVHPMDGRIFARDGQGGRINVYASDGSFLERWPLRSNFSTSTPFTMTYDGRLFTYTVLNLGVDVTEWEGGYVLCGPQGTSPDTLREPVLDFDPRPWQIVGRSGDENNRNTTVNNVPFSPTEVYALAPDGSVLAGVTDRYRIEVHHLDGSQTVIEKASWNPVRVLPEERAWNELGATASMRRDFPGWAWNGNPIPETKPAFSLLIPDRSGRVWVLRPGPGVHIEGCDEQIEDPTSFWRDPCWRDSNSLEVFELEGRYLGEVTLPEGIRFRPRPKFEGDRLVAYCEDDAGNPFVKLYRLEIGSGDGPD